MSRVDERSAEQAYWAIVEELRGRNVWMTAEEQALCGPTISVADLLVVLGDMRPRGVKASTSQLWPVIRSLAEFFDLPTMDGALYVSPFHIGADLASPFYGRLNDNETVIQTIRLASCDSLAGEAIYYRAGCGMRGSHETMSIGDSLLPGPWWALMPGVIRVLQHRQRALDAADAALNAFRAAKTAEAYQRMNEAIRRVQG